MRINTLIASLAATAVLSFAGQSMANHHEEAESPVAVAKEYLVAYSTFDVTNMEPFLSEDMVFIDPTAARQHPDGQPLFAYEGKQAVMKGLGDYASQFASFSLNYKVERQYESNGIVVFVAQLSYVGETKDGNKFEGTAPIVTAIAVKDGKVVRHTDYFDYKTNAEDFSE